MNVDPDLIEQLAAASHDRWLEAKRLQGFESRRAEWGEELMVPYARLTERSRELDRATVRSVLAAADRLGYVLRRKGAGE